ncbi:hypothetical protein L5515_017704 [Caenorhabditis briggsae]|uniref:Protein sleepless n=1 Tax=Caenorhabditis briggsae TaxID=6238 RepID=A0AAE9FF68_CAEBR|nr:hypothetical protein L3Y34_011839 [Caenorhabditis briggsae]UMM41439.1 hypothetical protein L5515_017704 [Caenorhabditis briggsae]
MLQNFRRVSNSIISTIFVFLLLVPSSNSINCYECTSSQGIECVYSATSCQYGLFGCVKIAILSGGVDKMGMFVDRERSIISMIRGCALIPFGGVDMCEQTTLFGTRVLKCTCFNDYCNSSPSQAVPVLTFLVAYTLLFLFG